MKQLETQAEGLLFDDLDDGPRSKKGPIIRAAIQHFGEHGYDQTKWASISEQVGIGQTALYHYFESKAHCLLVVLRLALERSLARVTEAMAEAQDASEGLDLALQKTFAISEFERLQLRVLQNNLSILSTRRESKVEEKERKHARQLVRDLEMQWTRMFRQGMKEGLFPARDPELLARTVLGTITSVWRWYRADGGGYEMATVGDFVSDACRRLVRD
jgi:TetR/AcrR family transcriptional regulator, cholesterol catabolism regulator